MTDDQPPERPNRPAASDEFDDLVLDDDFVRGGAFEPPARTRAAIARHGDAKTSWRHGGGLERPSRAGLRGAAGKDAKRARADVENPWLARLPLIVTIAVVAIVLVLAYH